MGNIIKGVVECVWIFIWDGMRISMFHILLCHYPICSALHI